MMATSNRAGFHTDQVGDWLLHLARVVAVPAVLHGLYDTLLKRDMCGYALLVALASFAWLVFLIERARSGEEQAQVRRYLAAAA